MSRVAKSGPGLWTITLLVSVLIGALGFVSPASATDSSGAAVAQPSGFQAKALPKRNLNDRLVQKPRGLFIKGNVNPGWAHKPVVIQKANCKTCKFKKVGKARTNGKGKWSYRLSAPARGNWFWKGFVKKSGKYGKSPTNFIYKTWR